MSSSPPARSSTLLVLGTLAALSGCGSTGSRMAPVDEVTVSPAPGAPVAAPVTATVTSPAPAGHGPSGAGTGGAEVRPLAMPAPATPMRASGQSPARTPAAVPAGAPPAAAAEPPAPASLNPAVVALVNEANRSAYGGDHEHAVASLERALQVDPYDAWLWYRLARERLAQGHTGQAQTLAAKSNALATGNTRLQAENWRLIAAARRAAGDAAGAAAAQARARHLAQQ